MTGTGKPMVAGPGLTHCREASRCVKCGTCLSVCPVYSAHRRESHSPRGKLALVEANCQGAAEESDLYRHYLETCLFCGACEEACPTGVATLSAMIGAREHVAKQTGLRLGKGLVLNHLLRAASLMRLALKTGWIFQRLAFKRLPASSGLRRRFPLPLVPSDREVPTLSRQFFTEIFDGTVREGDGPRVGIFAGCMVNYFYPQIGESMVRLLGVLGATVVVPARQSCCGMPALTGGAHDTVVELAKENLAAFEGLDLDVIVTGCASCGENLKANYRSLLTEAGVSPDRIEDFVSRVRDINEFLTHSGLLGFLRGEIREAGGEAVPITYHHPCHLGRMQGLRAEPLSLIRSMPGAAFVPMRDADRCCGMGGSFSVEHYELSKRINDRKIADIVETGARAVVTSCPACILHIRDGLRRNGVSSVEVLHVTEFLSRAMLKGMTISYSEDEEWEEPAAGPAHEEMYPG